VQPQSQIVPLGASDTITVIATGVPAPGYQWRFNRTNLADNAHIANSHSNTLAIASLLTGDAGNYDVIVSNAYGSVTSVLAFVKFSNPGSPPTNVPPSVIWA